MIPRLVADEARLTLDRALGDAAQCARSAACATPAGDWVRRYLHAWEAGDELVAWDRYGRWLGRARVRRQGSAACVDDAWIERGRLQEAARHLARQLLPVGTLALLWTRRGRTYQVSISRLARGGLAAAASPLHPVLAGMAATDAEASEALGQGLGLLAEDGLHRQLSITELVTRLQRAQGSGQLWLHAGADGVPSAVMLWARPSSELRSALQQHRPERFHAADWNAGGEPVVLALCARDGPAAQAVAQAVLSLPAPGDSTLHIRLTDAAGQPAWVPVARADWPEFARWLASALPAASTAGSPCC